MVVIVSDKKDLEQLITELRLPTASTCTPEAITMVGTLHYVIQGKTTAKIFTDEWPHFSAVVCQIFYPRKNTVADCKCYATSSSALVRVFKEGNLLLSGTAIYVAKRHTISLVKEIPGLQLEFEAPQYYLPEEADSETQRSCPSGFVIGKLLPSDDHVELVASLWNYMKEADGPRIFKDLIETYHTCAIYTTDDAKTPVAWGMQYNCGQIGHVYTLPEYRRKGLSTIVVRELCKLFRADGLTPQAFIGEQNTISRNMFLKLGFAESVCWSIYLLTQ